MRNLQLEAAIWNLFSSTDFFNGVAQECDDTLTWFGSLAVSKKVSNFGRNNQIFEKIKQRRNEFRRGAELAALGDYQLIWGIAGAITGDIRGMLDQPLRSWMTDAEYDEFFDVRMGSIIRYSESICRALNNTMIGLDYLDNSDSDDSERSDDDDGFPGAEIAEWYEDFNEDERGKVFCALPNPLPNYAIDRSIACKTGDEVPWTGVWYPTTGLEFHSLTFAVKGMKMQPVYKVVKTTDELRTPEWMFPPPETLAVATVWHPVVPAAHQAEKNEQLWAKAGQPCPKAGLWQPTDPGVQARKYEVGDKMLNLGSAQGLTVWLWIADR